jgi:hypothetical protein
VSAEKKPTPPASGGGRTPAACTTGKCPYEECVVKVTAKIPGTKGKRDAAKKRSEKTLAASSSSDETLAGNPPVILARGCLEVELAAETTPPDKPVTWQVKPTENPGGTAPSITPKDGGKKATLKTGETGSFSVIATLGSCKVVWNVVFVWVKVDPTSTSVTTRANKFADNGAGRFKSGDFSAGNFPWESSVKVELKGGGADGKMGIEKIRVHILQNGTGDSLTGVYVGGGTGKETVTGGLPVLDSNANSPSAAANPYVYVPSSFSVKPDDTSKDRELWTGDAPGGSFDKTHNGRALKSIQGTNDFKAAAASTSEDAPDAIVVHAGINWSADFAGTVDAAGTYTPNGAKATSDLKYALISEATGGQDACDAGYETFPPIFRDVGITYSF